MYSSMSYPWHSTKYLVHIMSGSLSGIDINSISVELCALHFIIFDELISIQVHAINI
jgi:hypothetical protein